MREIFIRRADHQPIRITGTIQIGRDSACPICVSEARVSRLHATLRVKDDFLYVQDEESSNGTYVNGVRIFRQTLLQHGDRLRVGDTTFTAEYGREADTETQEADDQAPTFPVSVKPARVSPPPVETPPPAPPPAPPVPPAQDMDGEDLDEYPEARPEPAARTAVPPAAEDPHRPYPSAAGEHGRASVWDDLRQRWGGIIVIGAALLLALAWVLIAVLPGTDDAALEAQPTEALFAATAEIAAPPPETAPVQEPPAGTAAASPAQPQTQPAYPGGVKIEMPVDLPPQAYSLRVTEDILPDFPAPLKAVSPGITLRIEGQLPLPAPVLVSLPLSAGTEALQDASERIAVYRFVAGNWILAGGLMEGNELHFWQAESGSFRAAYLPDTGKTTQYRPFKIVNTGGIALTARVWKWWLPLDYILPEPGNLANALTRLDTQDGASPGEAIGFLSLPYGTYSAWCFTWRDPATQQERAILRQYDSALTPYSCTWQSYRRGTCEPERITVNIAAGTPGEAGGCENAPILPLE